MKTWVECLVVALVGGMVGFTLCALGLVSYFLLHWALREYGLVAVSLAVAFVSGAIWAAISYLRSRPWP